MDMHLCVFDVFVWLLKKSIRCRQNGIYSSLAFMMLHFFFCLFPEKKCTDTTLDLEIN